MEEKNLQNAEISYTHVPSSMISVPYKLKVVNGNEFYLILTQIDENTKEQKTIEKKLDDLTPDEQKILSNANSQDPTNTPPNVIAGIYIARQILAHSKSNEEAIAKCNRILYEKNETEFSKRQDVSKKQIKPKRKKANDLEECLKMKEASEKYARKQASPLGFLRRLRDALLTQITQKPHGGPPCSPEELEKATSKLESFREEMNASPDEDFKTLLNIYRYHETYKKGESFSYLYESPELLALRSEYVTTNIALQIIDGSALEKATRDATPKKHTYQKRMNISR